MVYIAYEEFMKEAWNDFMGWGWRAKIATLLLTVGVIVLGVAIKFYSSSVTPLNVSPNNNVTAPTVSELTDNIELGQTITMRIDGLKPYNDKNKKSSGSLILYLNGTPLKIHPSALPSENIVSFYLQRTDETKDAWLTILRPQTGQNLLKVPVNVSAGYENESPFLTDYKDSVGNPKQYYLKAIPVLRLIFFLVILLGLGLVIAIHAPSMLRDKGSVTYSLARTLFLYWTCIVIVAFGFIYLITWDYNSLSGSAVILLGIVAGTTLGAVLVDAAKIDNATIDTKADALVKSINDLPVTVPDVSTQLASIISNINDLRATSKNLIAAAKTAKTTTKRNWLKDITSDPNGISLQRVQVLLWSVVLGIIFLVSVVTTLSMPAFSDTLLLLIGISSGTYLGLKIPEQAKTT